LESVIKNIEYFLKIEAIAIIIGLGRIQNQSPEIATVFAGKISIRQTN
jgi:hypothetical protein